MELFTIRKMSYHGITLLGAVFATAAEVRAVVLSHEPAVPIGIAAAEFNGDYDGGGPFTGTPKPLTLDLNGDGVGDLIFSRERYTLYIESQGEHGVDYWFSASETITDVLKAASTANIHGAAAVAAGELIGPDTSSWIDQALATHTSLSEESCIFYDYRAEAGYSECYIGYSDITGGALFGGDSRTDDYFGFSFLVDGREHFGWADVEVAWSGAAFINAWGWETEAGAAIAAGATSTPVSLPSAAWLFGTGLLALLGRPGRNNQSRTSSI